MVRGWQLLTLLLLGGLAGCTDDGGISIVPSSGSTVTTQDKIYQDGIDLGDGYDQTSYVTDCSGTAASVPGVIHGYACYADAVMDAASVQYAMNWQSKPIRHAMVELVNGDGQVVTHVMSDNSGYYEFSNLSQYGITDGEVVYLRVMSVGYIPSWPVQRVIWRDMSPDLITTYLYAVSSSAQPFSLAAGNSINLVADTYALGSVFNILDQAIDAQQYLESLGKSTGQDLNLIWYPGSADGSYYWQSEIYLYGMATDNDAYDDSVILHEYGHHALDLFSVDHSPGGYHSISDINQDPRLSWSEGFATTFQSLVKRFRGDTDSEWYLDSYGMFDYINNGWVYSPRILYEIESTPANEKGLASEWAVSSLLLDLMDDSPLETLQFDGQPEATFLQGEVWFVLEAMRGLSHPLGYPSFISYQNFDDLWSSYYGSLELGRLKGEFSIETADDIYEPDDRFDLVVSPAMTDADPFRHYTFFGGTDEDWIKVRMTAGVTYWLETFNLHSGADTHIYLYDQNGTTLITQNDDGSSQSGNYCSRITYSPGVSGDYYIRVDRYEGDDWLMRYGSYDFSITDASSGLPKCS